MTAEEIKNLIDQKIAGQGTMVDVGGALPTILKEIVDMAGSPAAPTYVDCGYSEADSEPVFDNEQKAALLQEYNKGNLANVVCRYYDELSSTSRYFKIVAWEVASRTLIITGANTGGTTTVKRWEVRTVIPVS